MQASNTHDCPEQSTTFPTTMSLSTSVVPEEVAVTLKGVEVTGRAGITQRQIPSASVVAKGREGGLGRVRAHCTEDPEVAKPHTLKRGTFACNTAELVIVLENENPAA